MKEKATKMKITKGMMDKLIEEAKLNMVWLFASGEILNVMENDTELFEASVPSIMMDRDYFRDEFDMVIGEA